MLKTRIQGLLNNLSSAVMSVILALFVGSIVLIASGLDPLKAYSALFYGAFGTIPYLGNTLSRATPLIFTGLAIGVGFRGGMFNIGAEGQAMMGALAAAIAGYALNLPMILHIPFCIIIAMLVSGGWAFIPGYLKATKGIHEVISTIMMNYIALNVSGYLVEALRQNEMPQTPSILESAALPRLSVIFPALRNASLNMGFILAILTAVFMYIVIHKTVFGYEVRAVGFNTAAAEDAGINLKGKIISIVMISGMLAGLGGAERALGVQGTFVSGITTNLGFEGIAVALLAGNHPIGTIFSAILFGALASGGQYMNLAANVPVDIVGIVQALIILFAAINQAVKFIDFSRLFQKGVRK